MSRFVRPEVKVLKLSNGDTLTVKRHLNSGEQRDAFAAMATASEDGNLLRVNRLKVGRAMILAYLLDWSFTDDDGKLVEIRDMGPDVIGAAVDDLWPDDFDEVREEIEKHDGESRAERERRKNGSDGETKLSATSPSPSISAGDTSGSPS